MKVSILDQTHAEYDGERLQELRALHEGGAAWDALKNTWFPKFARESTDVWKDRKEQAEYVNHAGPVVSMLSALLFSSETQADGADGAYYAGLREDCDGQGTDWDDLWREQLEDAQVGGWSAVWINFPAKPEDAVVESVADQDQFGLRNAFLVPLSAEQIRNWGVDANGLSWVMLRGVFSRQLGPTEPARTVYRWTAITRETVTTWEWVSQEDKLVPGSDEDVQQLSQVQHGVKDPAGRPALPVVPIELPPGLWTMGKLRGPALKLTRAENDLDWALHQAANELLVIKTRATAGEVKTGHGAYLILGVDDDASFVGPSGVAFEHLDKRVTSTREDLYRVVHQMALAADQGAAEASRSGESKSMDWQAMEIILAAFQALVIEAMQRCLRLIAASRGEPTVAKAATVGGLEGWKTEDLTAWLESVLLAGDASKLSPTYRKEVAKHEVRRLLEGKVDEKTMQAIEKEIDAADATDSFFAGVTPPPPADRSGATTPAE